MEKYIVIRSHTGDKPYKVGEERTARKSDVSHLIPKVLALPGTPEAKAAIKRSKQPPRIKKPVAKKPAPKKSKPSTAKKASGSGRRKSQGIKKPKTRAQKDRANELARQRRAAKKASQA